jgi:ATP-dependent DNA helicase RecG
MDADLVEMARDVAEEMLTAHGELAERHLKRWLGSREELLKS